MHTATLCTSIYKCWLWPTLVTNKVKLRKRTTLRMRAINMDLSQFLLLLSFSAWPHYHLKRTIFKPEVAGLSRG